MCIYIYISYYILYVTCGQITKFCHIIPPHLLCFLSGDHWGRCHHRGHFSHPFCIGSPRPPTPREKDVPSTDGLKLTGLWWQEKSPQLKPVLWNSKQPATNFTSIHVNAVHVYSWRNWFLEGYPISNGTPLRCSSTIAWNSHQTIAGFLSCSESLCSQVSLLSGNIMHYYAFHYMSSVLTDLKFQV